MFRRNTLIFGVIQGLVFPALFFFVLKALNDWVLKDYMGSDGITEKFIAILSIGANLIPITLANRNRETLTMRGIMTSTLILTAVVVVYYWDQFNS
jgi:hypothetical protein